MPALVAGIHVFGGEATSLVAMAAKQDVDGRDKPGHDDGWFCPKRNNIRDFDSGSPGLFRDVYNHGRDRE